MRRLFVYYLLAVGAMLVIVCLADCGGTQKVVSPEVDRNLYCYSGTTGGVPWMTCSETEPACDALRSTDTTASTLSPCKQARVTVIVHEPASP
jgi:hypothetical protein